MKKGAIKVIKRKDIAERAAVAAVVAAVKDPAGTNRSMVKAVNDWITDRQESRDLESDFSNNKILSWELLPETFNKTTS